MNASTPICSGRLKMHVRKSKLGGWTTTPGDRCFTDPELPAHFQPLGSSFDLLKRVDNPFFAVSFPWHFLSFLGEPPTIRILKFPPSSFSIQGHKVNHFAERSNYLSGGGESEYLSGGTSGVFAQFAICLCVGKWHTSPVKGRIDVTYLPQGGGPNASHAACLGGWQLTLSAYSKNKDAAAKLIKYMVSSETQKDHASSGRKSSRLCYN
jgi:hypothetical protein